MIPPARFQNFHRLFCVELCPLQPSSILVLNGQFSLALEQRRQHVATSPRPSCQPTAHPQHSAWTDFSTLIGMRPLTSTLSSTSRPRLMWRAVWRGTFFFYWLTLGLRKCDLHQRGGTSVSGADLSGNTGQLAELQMFDPQGQDLNSIDKSRLLDDGRSHLPTTHAVPVDESTIPENAFPNLRNQDYSTTLPDDVLSSKSRRCTCFVCLKLFKTSKPKEAFPSASKDGQVVDCRVPGCDWKSKARNSFTNDYRSRIDHEKRHFMEPGPNSSLACTQDHCNFITKREPDLRRHYRSMHCLNPEIFSCPVLWCKYSGVNGFARKDKLTSHYRNVHGGTTARQALQYIQPALPAASASQGPVSVSIWAR